jgi:hypothetical protein
MIADSQISELAALVRDQMGEIDRLRCVEVQAERTRAENARLKAENQRLVDWIMGDEPDALTYLQRVYSDPNASEARRDKTAIGALAYERAKPAATVNNVIDFKRVHATLETNWQKIQAERWAKVIEPPKAPLDFDAEPEPTLLGGANDEAPDPAA